MARTAKKPEKPAPVDAIIEAVAEILVEVEKLEMGHIVISGVTSEDTELVLVAVPPDAWIFDVQLNLALKLAEHRKPVPVVLEAEGDSVLIGWTHQYEACGIGTGSFDASQGFLVLHAKGATEPLVQPFPVDDVNEVLMQRGLLL